MSWEGMGNMMSVNEWRASFCQSFEEVWVELICDGSRGGRAKFIIFFGIIWVFEYTCCSSSSSNSSASKRKKSFLHIHSSLSLTKIYCWNNEYCFDVEFSRCIRVILLAWAHALTSTYAPIPHTWRMTDRGWHVMFIKIKWKLEKYSKVPQTIARARTHVRTTNCDRLFSKRVRTHSHTTNTLISFYHTQKWIVLASLGRWHMLKLMQPDKFSISNSQKSESEAQFQH